MADWVDLLGKLLSWNYVFEIPDINPPLEKIDKQILSLINGLPWVEIKKNKCIQKYIKISFLKSEHESSCFTVTSQSYKYIVYWGTFIHKVRYFPGSLPESIRITIAEDSPLPGANHLTC